MAAMLAGMCFGIEHKLDPGAPVVGNGYEAVTTAPPMPTNWFAALDRFSGSEVMKDLLGARFVEMFSIVKQTEMERFFGAVPDLDYAWYLRTA